MEEQVELNSEVEEPESVYSAILAKGRITVWIILAGSFASAMANILTGDQLLEVLKFIGPLWLGGELAARKN